MQRLNDDIVLYLSHNRIESDQKAMLLIKKQWNTCDRKAEEWMIWEEEDNQ